MGKKSKALCEAAVRANGYALCYVPKHLITKKLVKLAVESPFPVKEVFWPNSSYAPVYIWRPPLLARIPAKYLSEEFVALSIRLHPANLQYAPAKYVSYDLCCEMIERDPMNLRYMPAPDVKLVDYALSISPQAILAVPPSFLTVKRCRNALRRDPTIPIEEFPEDIRKKLERRHDSLKDILRKLKRKFHPDPFVKYETIALETPSRRSEDTQLVLGSDELHSYDLSLADDSVETIYYISDIHLEHQLGNTIKRSLFEVQNRIDEKIDEMLASVPATYSTLLVGGDVADSIALEALFYERLNSKWSGSIISVLGNHELWDGDPTGHNPARPVDEIIAEYRQAIPSCVWLLENELFIIYKGFRYTTLDEQDILDSSVEELAEVCNKSTFLLLGGIGFSGLNPIYNAEMGLYRAVVSTEEDIVRSKRFREIYEKVLASAKNIPVIVLTHTQMADWSDAQYNPKWIYVSGHTHINELLLQPDGTAVFSDNQVGYQTKTWHLNSFTIDVRRYDTFQDYSDGIYQITREQYFEFNRLQGIKVESMKHPGDLYMLKHDGAYMFLLKSASSLCLLAGGHLHRLDYDIEYYYDNLPEYVRKVHNAFTPYWKTLATISDEVKLIGGSGRIHGCIVDIDFYHHVYLNPFDGKVTPYCALNTTDKIMFENMESLLRFSPFPPQLVNGDSMLERYSATASSEEKKLSILSNTTDENCKLAAVPQVVLDKSMYEPSRLMRSVQYIFDHNVVRIWKDEVLALQDSDESRVLTGADRQLNA